MALAVAMVACQGAVGKPGEAPKLARAPCSRGRRRGGSEVGSTSLESRVGRIELWARAGDRSRGGVIRKTLSPNHLTGFQNW